MSNILEPMAETSLNALYECIKSPLDQFAEKREPTRRFNWYHDEPRWLFRWGQDPVTQVEVRVQASRKGSPSLELVFVAAAFRQGHRRWETRVVGTLPAEAWEAQKLVGMLDETLKAARSLASEQS